MGSSMMHIVLFLGTIMALIGFHVWLGSVAATLAEKKGYASHFGFLLGFYFSFLGYFVLTRLKPDTAELEYRKRAEAERAEKEQLDQLQGNKTPLPAPWKFQYPGLRPSFPLLYSFLGIGLVISLFLSFQVIDDSGRSADLNLVPRASIGGWTYVQDVPLDSDTNNSIKADASTMRVYVSPTGQEVDMYIVYRRYGRREFNHNPSQCFPAGGYRPLHEGIAKLPYAGKDHEAKLVVYDGSKVVRRDGSEGVPQTTVTYFFASGKKTEHVFLRQQMWMALERLVPNKNGWALIRLTTPRKTTDEDALAAQQEFMRVYGPEIEKAITTDYEGDKNVAQSPDLAGGASVAVR